MKKTKFILLFISLSAFVLTGAFIFAQQGMDSLLTLLKKDKEDTGKVIHSYKLCSEYLNIGSYDTALHYGSAALHLGKKINFRKGIASSYNNIGNIYYSQGNYDKALENYLASLQRAEEIGDKQVMAMSYNGIGSVYRELKQPLRAIEYFGKALDAAKEIGSKEDIKESCQNLSEIYSRMSDYKNAYEYYRLYSPRSIRSNKRTSVQSS